MNWLFFFLLVLAFVATTTTLASPVDNSPSVPKDDDSPTVSKETIEEEFKFLEQYRGLNQEPQFFEAIISTIAQAYGIDKTVISHAVKEARKGEIFFDDVCNKLKELEDSLEMTGPPRGMFGIAMSALEALPVKPWEAEHVGNAYNDNDNMDYLFTLILIQRTIKVATVEKEFQDVGNAYNDNDNMDYLFTLILTKRTIKVATVEKKFQNIGPRAMGEWLRAARREIAGEQHEDLFGLNLRDWVDKDVHATIYEALAVWNILQAARQEIKEERSQLDDQYARNPDVDDQMIQKLVPLLSQYANEDEIREMMEQARHANTLKGAFLFYKQNALRELLKSHIQIPASILKSIPRDYREVEDWPSDLEDQDKIMEILRQHPSFADTPLQ